MRTRRTPRGSDPAAIALLVAALAGTIGCGAGSEGAPGASAGAPTPWEAKGPMTTLTLPDGFEMRCEMRLTPEDQAEGMMFRPELPPDVCMLFVFQTLEPRPFWMYQTPHPLDIVWLDDNKQIVEMSPNTPPCTSRDARDCPNYGGSAPSVYVAEFRSGTIDAHGLERGRTIDF